MKNQVNWSDKEVAILVQGRTQGLEYASIGAKIGKHKDACRSKFNRMTPSDRAAYSNLKTYATKGKLAQDVEIEEDPVQLQKEKLKVKQINALETKQIVQQSKNELIQDVFAKYVKSLPPTKVTYKKPYGKHSPEDAALVLSDLHAGHNHTYDETGGISQYNEQIFRKRMKNLKDSVLRITENHRNAYDVPNLHIFALGDNVAGMNSAGAWSSLYVSSSIVDQVMLASEEIAGLIHDLSSEFETINFYGQIGNHGRVNKLNDQKDHDNWDYIVYKFLEARFSANERVKFHIPKSWWQDVTIKNHNFLLVHGDFTKSNTVPLKSLLDFEKSMVGITKKIPNYTIAGHYHNAAEMTSNNGKVILNGSFVGSDVYSLKNIHAGSVPEQKFFGIHDKKGITWNYNINLDHGEK